ncbi:MAG: hypothetical protein HC895_16425, partial [Leptolyngbyaceae cyanobacterium SM1_3_5]|nr:hypothetical protein [Leptolyngbyaceae cyanobacterium SM1_3_5]
MYTMLLDVMGAPGELPLLQYTLQQLWQQRQVDNNGVAHLTLDTYTALGGIRGTLQQRATEVFNRLTPAEQAIAQRIFLALTQLGEGTEDTRRRVVKSELVRPDCSIEQTEQTLEKLVAAKLVIASQGDETAEHSEAIDVTHEALIRAWPLLRTWLETNREMLRRQRRIEQAAQEWQQAGRSIAPEYLLHGARLTEAEDFVRTHVQELSALAQEYVYTSQQERDRVRRASRRLQFALPAVVALALLAVAEVALRPGENVAETALPLSTAVVGDTTGAVADGPAACGFSDLSPDLWYRFTAATDIEVYASTEGSSFDTVLSVYEGCPRPFDAALECADGVPGCNRRSISRPMRGSTISSASAVSPC